MANLVWLSFEESPSLDNTGRVWTETGSPTVSTTNAKSGKALQLDGSCYLTTTENFTLGGQDFTIDGWAYLSSASMTLRRFIFEFYNPSTNNILTLYSNKTGTQLTLMLKINDTNDIYLASATPLKNQLFHFAVVYKKSTNKMTLYINGNVVYDVSAGRLRNTAPFTELNLGYARSHDAYWKGTIDEFRFYDGEALYSSAFTVPDVDSGITDTCRSVTKAPWRYENAGYAEKTLRGGYDVTPTSEQSRTGTAFWYYNNNGGYYNLPQLPFPTTPLNELWVRADVCFRGAWWYFCTCYNLNSNESWKRNGLGYASYQNAVPTLYSNGTAVYTFPNLTGLHQILLHIVPGEKIEFWLDGNLEYSYVGTDVNNGHPITNFCMVSQNGSGSALWSNIIISETSLLNDNTIIYSSEWQYKQPLLSSSTGNGTMGVDDFAVSIANSDQTDPWRIFDGNDGTNLYKAQTGVAVTFYTSTAIKINYLYMFGQTYLPAVGVLAYSDDGTTFTDCGGWDDSVDGKPKTWSIVRSNERGYHNYYRLTVTTAYRTSASINCSINNVGIDAFIELPGESGYADTIRVIGVPGNGYGDTLRKVTADTEQAGYSDTLRLVGYAADTLRFVSGDQSGYCGTLREVLFDVGQDFDGERDLIAVINQVFDTEVKVPHEAVISPVPSPSPEPSPLPEENAGTIRSISITLNEQQITDDLTFEAVGNYSIMELIQGSYLDYNFSMRIESMRTSGGITEASCCSDVDELLYTQLAYHVPENEQWHVVNPDTHEEESQEVASASTHITKIARVLGKTPIIQFTDFISTADVEPQGLTYATLISNIFGFTASIPHKMINCYIRGGNLYVVQRGHEQNTIDLTNAKITVPTITKELVRTTWGSDVWSKTETKTQKKFQGFDEELEWYPERNEELNQDYTYDSDGLVSQSITIDETSEGRTMTQVDYHYTTSNGRKFLSMEETTVTYNYGTSKAYTETRKVYHTPLNNGQEHVHGIDEDGEPIGSNVGGKRWTDKPTPYQYYFSGWLKSITKTPQYKEIEMERTLYGISLVDTSFPVVGDAKLIELTNDLKWLNRKTKETISFDLYDYPHLIDFNDRIALGGNTYFVQSNKATRDTRVTNKQSLTLVRWY